MARLDLNCAEREDSPYLLYNRIVDTTQYNANIPLEYRRCYIGRIARMPPLMMYQAYAPTNSVAFGRGVLTNYPLPISSGHILSRGLVNAKQTLQA